MIFRHPRPPLRSRGLEEGDDLIVSVLPVRPGVIPPGSADHRANEPVLLHRVEIRQVDQVDGCDAHFLASRQRFSR